MSASASQITFTQLLIEHMSTTIEVLPSVPNFIYGGCVTQVAIDSDAYVTKEVDLNVRMTDNPDIITQPFQLVSTSNIFPSKRMMTSGLLADSTETDLAIVNGRVNMADFAQMQALNRMAIMKTFGQGMNNIVRGVFRSTGRVLTGLNYQTQQYTDEAFAAANTVPFNYTGVEISTAIQGLSPNKIAAAIEVARETYNHYQSDNNHWYVAATTAQLRMFFRSLSSLTNESLWHANDYTRVGNMVGGLNQFVTDTHGEKLPTVTVDNSQITFIVDDGLKGFYDATGTETYYLPMWQQPQGILFGTSGLTTRMEQMPGVLDGVRELFSMRCGARRGALPYIYSLEVKDAS